MQIATVQKYGIISLIFCGFFSVCVQAADVDKKADTDKTVKSRHEAASDYSKMVVDTIAERKKRTDTTIDFSKLEKSDEARENFFKYAIQWLFASKREQKATVKPLAGYAVTLKLRKLYISNEFDSKNIRKVLNGPVEWKEWKNWEMLEPHVKRFRSSQIQSAGEEFTESFSELRQEEADMFTLGWIWKEAQHRLTEHKSLTAKRKLLMQHLPDGKEQTLSSVTVLDIHDMPEKYLNKTFTQLVWITPNYVRRTKELLKHDLYVMNISDGTIPFEKAQSLGNFFGIIPDELNWTIPKDIALHVRKQLNPFEAYQFKVTFRIEEISYRDALRGDAKCNVARSIYLDVRDSENKNESVKNTQKKR